MSTYQMADGLLSVANKTKRKVKPPNRSLGSNCGQEADAEDEIVEEALHSAEGCSERTFARFTNVSVPQLWSHASRARRHEVRVATALQHTTEQVYLVDGLSGWHAVLLTVHVVEKIKAATLGD